MNRDTGETFLASLFSSTESDDDSAFDPDASVASAETGGDSLFDDLSLASGDVQDVYGQRTGRPDDESNEEENAGPPDSPDENPESTIFDHK